MADDDVVGGNGKVAGNVKLVAAADNHAVEASDGRLANVAKAGVGFDEGPHPLPGVGALLEESLLLIEVSAGQRRWVNCNLELCKKR
jgi:hypothetical protein